MKSFEAKLGVKMAGRVYRTTVEFVWREEWEEFTSWTETMKGIREMYQGYRIAGCSRQYALDQAAKDIQDALYDQEDEIGLQWNYENMGLIR